MSIPAGVATFNVTFNSAVTSPTGDPVTVTVTIKPDTNVVWAATSTPLLAVAASADATAAQSGTITLPDPDQDGFTNGLGATIRGFTYTAQIAYKLGANTIATATKTISHLSTDGNIDLNSVVQVTTSSGTTTLIGVPTQRVTIGTTDGIAATIPHLWVQTGLGGGGVTMWLQDGT